MSLCPWMIWRCRLDSSTSSNSAMPSVPDPGRGQVEQGGRAEAAGADDEHLGVLQPLLPGHPDVGDDQVAAVAAYLVDGQLVGRLDQRGQGHGFSSGSRRCARVVRWDNTRDCFHVPDRGAARSLRSHDPDRRLTDGGSDGLRPMTTTLERYFVPSQSSQVMSTRRPGRSWLKIRCGVLRQRGLAVDRHPVDAVVDLALAGPHRDLVAVLERLEVVHRTTPGVHGVAGDEGAAELRARVARRRATSPAPAGRRAG